jgi:hypothetical protein
MDICEERGLTGWEDYRGNKINFQQFIFNQYITKNNAAVMALSQPVC